MPGHLLAEALRRLRPAVRGDSDRPDADLLASYAARRDEAAFETLVRRHGPMVLGVCRRVLRGEADAEDAFQATFLVLARRAGAVRDRAAVGNWLYGVALNVARRARVTDRRRRATESAAGAVRPVAHEWHETDTLVDDELGRLPDKYRIALVCCGLEGKTIREAAADLGWPPGTVATRLARGRDLLARRLVRRGVAVPVLAAGTASAAVPETLVEQTCQVAGAVGSVPAAVLTLTNEVTRSMFLTKLKTGAVALLAAAGVGAAAVFAQSPTADPPAAAKAAPAADPTPARKLLDKLLELKPKNGGEALNDDTAVVLRDFINLGPAAVPDMIAELDTTTDPFMLRCLGFAARAIDDKRVVPALIRAFPKTCQSPRSDYGLNSKDPELLAFLQKHSHSKKDGGTHYSFGRPLTEFRSALQKLTGANHGEDELNFAFLEGSERQQHLQRSQFQRCAERWAAWWEADGRALVPDPKYARVGLPPLAPLLPPPAVGSQFPHGPKTTVVTSYVGNTLQSAREVGAKFVFKDLDTGREAALPDRLRAAARQPERIDEITAWATGEGFDLMGTEYISPDGGRPYYVLRGIGLTAWEIDASRRDKLEAELKTDKPLDMGKPVGGLLARFDTAAGKYRPEETGLFLFRTREGSFGWISVGVEVHDDTLKPGGAVGGDPERSTIGFHKGRRYSFSLVADGK